MLFIFRNQIPPKKNSRQLLRKKRQRAIKDIPSKRYIEWNKNIIKNINNVVNNIKDLYKYKDKENLSFKAVFSPLNKRSFDLTNIIQSIEDTFTDIGIIEDDKYRILSSFQYKVSNFNNKEIFCIVELVSEEENTNNFDNIFNYLKTNDYISKYKYAPKKITTVKKEKNKELYYMPK